MDATLRIALKRVGDSGVDLPRYMTEDAAGMDLAAAIKDPLVLAPGERALVPCGFALALPRGYEGQVRPRSGLALKQGLSILNSPGTIDADYRGEVCVVVANLGADEISVDPGQRIAQLVIAPVCRAELELVAELDGTERGSGGFGHTS